jgi:hypothetical protein
MLPAALLYVSYNGKFLNYVLMDIQCLKDGTYHGGYCNEER